MELYIHCPKNNLNLRIKTEPVTVEDRCNDICLVYGPCIQYVNNSRTYSVASDLTVTGSVLMRRFRLFSGIVYKVLTQPYAIVWHLNSTTSYLYETLYLLGLTRDLLFYPITLLRLSPSFFRHIFTKHFA